ncbi:MAG: transketolase family protein, partial [Eubacteriales bacterium]
AAGAAAAGLIPFVSSFAMFAAGRAFEQIRNSIGYPHLNVKIGATHAGITVGEDGATHQCLEDLALMRTIPGMVVLNPADAVEARAAVEAAILCDGSVYMRFGRAAVPVLFDQNTYKFEIGKGITLAEGTDVTIAATGVMVEQALIAKELLANDGISARVINCATIKPIDRELLTNAARETGCVVTAEEHNIIGGFGSAVTEVLSETCPVPVLRVGTNDVFGRSGKVPPLMELYGLTAANIVEKAKAAVAMKKSLS